ncbi:FLU1-II [Trametes versicolor FP-101664 SS1]|uniref:FLU1-II n=1 Tax=Trametes versicolor (strain FP-101664) TaxID=717944 RepID=UPI0004624200|nr:FLU1-II [Trametes versicolor FP-101664 SS1]EIW55884.1 FLU1-II [Trametes versicolor FP-101664 SS1]
MATSPQSHTGNAQPYGVLYTSKSGSPKAKSLDELLTPDVQFVRVQWVDLINTIRYRILPAGYFRTLLSDPSSRGGVQIGKIVLGLVGLQHAPGFGAVGEYLYVPDLSSWRVCTYAPGHASVMGWFQEKTPDPQTGRLAVDLCPRTLLARLVQEAQEKAGVSFLVGVESEFILMRADTSELDFLNDAGWSCSAKTRTGSVETVVLEEIARDLIAAGVELQMYHAEAAPGQYEVITGPQAPLEAADTLVFTRETIYNVANKHGLRATFAPRLHTDSCGSGAHTHMSVHGPPARARTADDARAPTLTPVERSFLQGVLTHLPAICAFTLPTAASYARMVDGIWSGGTYAAWGTDNRETPVRLCGPRGHHHFEVKCVDATAAPHLAIAALVGAGLKGILDGAVLTMGDCPKPMWEMTEQEKVAVGMTNPLRLPTNIVDARKALVADEVIEGVLGANFVRTYIGVNETLEMFMQGKDEKETVKKLVEYY